LPSSPLEELIAADIGMGVTGVTTLAKAISAGAVIEKVNVSGCTVTSEAAAQLLTAANEASRARLRAHQVLAFSEALHARLGSECLLQAVALDTDVWRRVAENVRERHGHERMCSQLAQADQTWFEVTVEGLIAEGVSR
jgi:glycine/D-amino acid oxidase-like deaminating enzyme